MSVISNFTACGRGESAVSRSVVTKFGSGFYFKSTARITLLCKDDRFCMSRLVSSSSSRASKGQCVRMALVDERPMPVRETVERAGNLAYDLVQGALVKWNTSMDKSVPDPPTAVLLHGILGSRKNWGTFARKLAQEFPTWQFLLVDLRCHGDSASIKKREPHTVASTAFDVLKLVAQLRLTPRILIGHSFGGKVVLSMVEQAAKPLARPVRVWVLDATPGKVRAGGDGEDHPAELIAFLKTLPKEVSSKRGIVNALVQEGFSTDVAQWVVTNLRPKSPLGSSSPSFSWGFDLEGISEMFKSYEETNLWKFVENLPRGVHVNFLKAERSLHRWALEDLQRIHAAEDLAAEEGGGVQMHVLEDAGHWRYMVHHNEVELSALGMAIATVVTIAEILKNNGLVVEKKIMTSTVDMRDESRGRPVQKAKVNYVYTFFFVLDIPLFPLFLLIHARWILLLKDLLVYLRNRLLILLAHFICCDIYPLSNSIH